MKAGIRVGVLFHISVYIYSSRSPFCKGQREKETSNASVSKASQDIVKGTREYFECLSGSVLCSKVSLNKRERYIKSRNDWVRNK